MKLLALALLLGATPLVFADEHSNYHDDLIHSDLPLWGAEEEGVWPQHFYDEESFGCAHNVKLGDWQLKSRDDEESWYSLQNYGAFHCFLIVREGYKQAEMAYGDTRYSFLVNLGKFKFMDNATELWTLQLGGRPGSDYILLARTSPKDQPINSFDVLQVKCPRRNVRSGPALDGLISRYCAINSQRDLRRLAKRMAKLPPLGTLTFVEPAADEAEIPE